MKTVPVIPTARAAWPRWWPAGLAWVLWTLTMLGLAVTVWLDRLLIEAGLPELATVLSRGNLTSAAAGVSAATVGAVLASRRPRHPVGWLLLALGLSVVVSGVADGYASYGLVVRPGSLPGARWVALYGDAPGVVWSALVGFILLLTPTGSLPPRCRSSSC